METTITITTIHKPTFIEALCKNINEYEHEADILVIGDRKTPPIKDYLKQVSKQSKIPIEYLGIKEQEKIFQNEPSGQNYLR
jgi:hypothetical protein